MSMPPRNEDYRCPLRLSVPTGIQEEGNTEFRCGASKIHLRLPDWVAVATVLAIERDLPVGSAADEGDPVLWRFGLLICSYPAALSTPPTASATLDFRMSLVLFIGAK